MTVFTFSFDDGYRSWVEASQILSRNGFRGTFNICIRNMVYRRAEDRQVMFPNASTLTWDEAKKLQADGHEIGSHGISHTDFITCNRDEMVMEILGSKRILGSHGLNASTYACAFNSYVPAAEKVALKEYSSIRRVPAAFNRIPLISRGGYGSTDPASGLKLLSSLGKMDDVWIVCLWHDVNIPEFRRQAEAVRAAGVPVRTVRQMAG